METKNKTKTPIWTQECRVDVLNINGSVWIRVTTPGKEYGFSLDRINNGHQETKKTLPG